MNADTSDIRYVKKLAADRLRNCWGGEIMIFMIYSAIMVLCFSIFLTVYACFIENGIISGDFKRLLSESPLFVVIAVLIWVLAYLVSAPAYIGSCWWTVHYVRDESKDLKCLLSCYTTPRSFFRSIQVKLASDIPCTLLLAAVFGIYFLCDKLAAPFDGFAYISLTVLKWLITLSAFPAVLGLILRFAAVSYIYCLNHDDSCIDNIKRCFRLAAENKQLFKDTAAAFLKYIPLFVLVIPFIFIFPYSSTLFAAICVKMTESDSVSEKAADNDGKNA